MIFFFYYEVEKIHINIHAITSILLILKKKLCCNFELENFAQRYDAYKLKFETKNEQKFVFKNYFY